jgi:hypothetical protein
MAAGAVSPAAWWWNPFEFGPVKALKMERKAVWAEVLRRKPLNVMFSRSR